MSRLQNVLRARLAPGRYEIASLSVVIASGALLWDEGQVA